MGRRPTLQRLLLGAGLKSGGSEPCRSGGIVFIGEVAGWSEAEHLAKNESLVRECGLVGVQTSPHFISDPSKRIRKHIFGYAQHRWVWVCPSGQDVQLDFEVKACQKESLNNV